MGVQYYNYVWVLVWLYKIKIWWKSKTENFIVCIKVDDIYKDIAEDVETRLDTSNYELARTLSKENSKKVIRLIKDELSRKIMKTFVRPRTKNMLKLLNRWWWWR